MAAACTNGLDTGFVSLGYAKVSFLGVVQGITELMPISSTAHMRLVPWALGWPDPEEFRAELRLCRGLTGGKPFGVNLYISRQAGGVERAAQQIRVLCEEQVACVETAGASPEPVIPLLREAGIRILHKVPAVRYAVSAARLDIDAIILVGAECGGHPGVYQIGTMVQAAQQHDRQRGDRLAVGPSLGMRRQRDLAQVEFHGARHATEGAGDRIDLDEVEAHAV